MLSQKEWQYVLEGAIAITLREQKRSWRLTIHNKYDYTPLVIEFIGTIAEAKLQFKRFIRNDRITRTWKVAPGSGNTLRNQTQNYTLKLTELKK